MSYTSAEEQIADQQQYKEKCFRLGSVEALNEIGQPKIRFYGEEEASQKTYKMIKGYNPVVGDIVLLAAMETSYIIIGKVSSDLVDIVDYVTEEELEIILTAKLEEFNNTISENYASRIHEHNKLSASQFTSSYIDLVTGNAGCLRSTYAGWALGSPSYKWKELYATNSTIVTSDEREKFDIEELNDKYLNFLMSLFCYRYKYKNGTSDRFHTGFTSQDVERAMLENDIDSTEFAGFIKSPVFEKVNEDGSYDESSEIIDYKYSLRYEEFISLITLAIQRLSSENKDIERRLKSLEGKMSDGKGI